MKCYYRSTLLPCLKYGQSSQPVQWQHLALWYLVDLYTILSLWRAFSLKNSILYANLTVNYSLAIIILLTHITNNLQMFLCTQPIWNSFIVLVRWFSQYQCQEQMWRYSERDSLSCVTLSCYCYEKLSPPFLRLFIAYTRWRWSLNFCRKKRLWHVQSA